MTELEQHIYDSIKDRLPELNEKFGKMEGFAGKYVEVPFMCDEVLDTLVWDVVEKRFTHIKYPKGIGEGMSITPIGSWAAHFDESEIKTFKI